MSDQTIDKKEARPIPDDLESIGIYILGTPRKEK